MCGRAAKPRGARRGALERIRENEAGAGVLAYGHGGAGRRGELGGRRAAGAPGPGDRGESQPLDGRGGRRGKGPAAPAPGRIPRPDDDRMAPGRTRPAAAGLGPVVTFPSSARRAGLAASGACSRRAGP
nr:hypothetical protein StreXyl84_50820 [Streptomyces sp. Xyl84]